MRKVLSLILALVMLIGLLPMNVLAAETTESDANPYKGKVISILGDSISTFSGYIPVADGFNLAHRARYPQSNLLTDVNETWWMQVLTELDAKLGINDSWAGSRVSNTISGNSGDQGEKAAMASLTRIQNLGSNGTPDVILFYGGTNDIGALMTLGTFDSSAAPTEVDLNSTKWNSVADAYVAAILRMQYYYPNAEIVAMLPTYTSSYYTMEELDQYNAVFEAICEHYGVTYVDLRDCGITTANLPDGIHPDAIGMDYITKAVINILQNECDMQAGENVVHTISHNLSGAESSLGYYKGVSHGKPFIETITGENLTVTVTMGGADITNTVYADGIVTIAEVTGDIVITAKGRLKTIYEDHLQQLPAEVCSCLNLWDSLSPENTYYTGSGWGNISGNAVYSVTIPVTAGDQLWATSFQESGTNGGGRNGIRITWFDENGVLESLSPDAVHAEFSANGYLTVPEGAVAVNIPMWKMNDSNMVYILNREHGYKNGNCTACGVAQWDTDGDGALEILAIGNSFSVDALQYAYQIAQDLGIEEIVIGNLYIGGCSLNTHATNAAGDLAKYTYYYNDNGTWTSTKSYKISTALESRTWDYVSLQQASSYSGVESTYNADLTNLIAYVRERSEARLVWHMTWAYQQDSTHSAFPKYGSDQMTMYNAIVSAVQNKIVTNSDFDLIIPNGTAVQNSRTSLLGDTTTRDGYHMSYDYGRYLTGLLFIKTVTGLSVDDITYAPSGVDAVEMAIAIEAVNNADARPFAVTESSYTGEAPEEGYIQLQPELYQCAYWNATDKTQYNTLITAANNSSKYYASIRFTRQTLPVGSIIILADGWQYRPDGWITDTVQSSRADTTTQPYVVVTEEWWGDYTIRAFNIAKVGLPSLANVTEAEVRAAFRIYVPEESHSHSYEDNVCTLCGHIVQGNIWQILENGKVIGAFADLAAALDACEAGGTIRLTESCAVTAGVTVEKNVTIDGGNCLVDISGCGNAFITVNEGVEVTIRDLALDGGADGFRVDYDAVTYTNYTIPLVPGTLDSDPKASQSAIISSGKLICENVDISNRYTASNGGAMQILAGSLTLTGCDFTHNYGTSKGGALYIGSNFGTRTEYPVEKVTIENCSFTENYTGHGGAIYAYNMAEMTITNTVFDSNTANGGKGGAIDLFSETTKPTAAMALGLDFMQTTIRDCVFKGNWAGNDGFAIQSYDSDLYIYDSEFVENVGVHPTSSVGTVSIEAYRHADTSWRIYTLLDGCLFEGNRGPCAVYGDHSSISDLDVTDCVFRNNQGNDSFLLYSATTNMRDCQFIGETMIYTVIDARIYENYEIPPLLTLTDVSFTDCVAPTEILTRKQNHNADLNTYTVILQGTTNGDITIWDGNTVSILGTHTGNVQLDYGTERSSLIIGNAAAVKGIIFTQPESAEASMGNLFCVSVQAEGEGLKYQWYFRNAGSDVWYRSGVRDNTYDDVMTTARAGREVYCVITDANGNKVTTETAKLICVPSVELEITQQPVDAEAVLGEAYCVTVLAQGDGLKYQWYFRNAGSDIWYKSGVTDNTYDDVMTTARAGREIYCVITDVCGNTVTTEVVKLIRVPVKLEITSQPTDAAAALGEAFCATVEAKGEGLKYQWYFRNAGSDRWYKSGVRDNTYDDVMTKARMNREIYCVITDMWGNTVTTNIVKLIAVPKVELALLGQSYESAAMGERFCVTVQAQGEGLTYQWYFRNAGSDIWYKSGVRDNTYDDVMTKARANREVYCVITDAYGNQVITEVVTLIPVK